VDSSLEGQDEEHLTEVTLVTGDCISILFDACSFSCCL